MNHTSSETPRWVVLTPEQRDHLEQDVTVRGRRGPVLVEGPVDHVSEHGEVTIGHGRDGVVVTGPVEVRERDVPQLEDTGEPDLLAALAASVARARACREDSTASPVVEDPTCTECGEPVDRGGLTTGECGGGGGQKCSECFACSCDGSC